MSVASTFVDSHLARTRLRVATLDQWAMAGLALAATVVAQGGRSLDDLTRTLHRISRAVRLAIALAVRLSDPDDPGFPKVATKARPARAAEPEGRAAPARPSDEPAERSARAPQRDVGDSAFNDRAFGDDALLRRPLIDIVKVICRALGVTPDWSLWSDADDTPPQTPTAPAPAAAPPDPGGAIPERPIPTPRPRPPLVLDRPPKPPPAGRLRPRLMGASAVDALIPTFPPLALWRADAAARPKSGPHWDREPPGSPFLDQGRGVGKKGEPEGSRSQ